jgi:class 3 adenylate cyclase
VIEGGVLSTRLTLKVHDAELLDASVAVKVTTVVPTPLTGDPTAGDCVMVMFAAPEQLSLFVANER